ncbi:amidohydrolase family protein [Candidatus Woesearchaeota archaeon]|nr:amidohydrolase family protein [Candidatus Woesearchaeota archaeon]
MKKEVVLLFLVLTVFIIACTSQEEKSSSIDNDVVFNDVAFNDEEQSVRETEKRESNEQEGSEVNNPEERENNDLQESEDNEEQEDEQSIQEQHWNRVFAKAFEPVDCPQPRDPVTLPNGYYKGPMFDAHIHMQSLPDGEPGMPADFYTGENIGTKRSITQWVCMLEYEGTRGALVFFPVWEPIIKESLAVVKQTVEGYPQLIPFIMPPDDDGSVDGFPTVDAQELEEMLSIEPGLFKGYGEIGLYERPGGAPALSPNSVRLQEIYPVVREHNLVVYFHLGEGQADALTQAAQANPDINFIFHGDQLKDCAECDGTHKQIAAILEKNPNVYYGVDELYGGDWLLKPGSTKEDFINHFKDYDILLEKDLATFKRFIESHQDQVVFGTDRGVSTSWDLDLEVALTLNNYTRYFIGHLDPAVQEKIAYKNAEKIFS